VTSKNPCCIAEVGPNCNEHVIRPAIGNLVYLLKNVHIIGFDSMCRAEISALLPALLSHHIYGDDWMRATESRALHGIKDQTPQPTITALLIAFLRGAYAAPKL